MPKFFRNIRQKLLNENKFSKYVIYAIGEIILVVIGVLIALQIDNWNDFEKNKRQEQVIVDNILQDLKNDKAGLTDMIDKRTSKAASAAIMVSEYNGVGINKLTDYYLNWTIGRHSL
jgi:ABC-type phosphate transport system permease subunit